jgi:hypothetical protein
MNHRLHVRSEKLRKGSIEVQRPSSEIIRASHTDEMDRRYIICRSGYYFGATSSSQFVELMDRVIAYSLYSTRPVEEAKTQRSLCSFPIYSSPPFLLSIVILRTVKVGQSKKLTCLKARRPSILVGLAKTSVASWAVPRPANSLLRSAGRNLSLS